MASSADPEDSEKSTGRTLSLQMRLAILGIAGALLGTLAGGLVTWFVTQDQLASQRADARRAERLDAYSRYLGDAARLRAQVLGITEVTPRPARLSKSDAAAVKSIVETLTQDYVLVALVAPESVHDVARELINADIDIGNALETEPIKYQAYTRATMQATEGPNNFLKQFTAAAKKDLGTAGG